MAEENEWSVEVEDMAATLQLRYLLDQDLDPAPQPGYLKALVSKIEGLKVEVFAREHPPPHFRVAANGETANYRIDDCTQLNGGLRRHYRSIRKWHAQNQQTLIQTWNAMRPSDCPVGAYRSP